MYYPKRKLIKEGPPAFEYFKKKSDAKAVAIIIVSSAICSCLFSLRLLQKRRREGVVNNARSYFNNCEGDTTGQKVIIIGGGASGSALAAQLTQQHPELYVTVIEHQARRVFTGCIPLAQVGIRSYDIMRVGVWDSLRSPATWNITREADLVMGKVQKIDAIHKKVYVLPNDPELIKLKIDQLNRNESSSSQEQQGRAQHELSTETRATNSVDKYNTSAKIDSIGKSFTNRYANESKNLGLSVSSDYHNKELSKECEEQEEERLPVLSWKRVHDAVIHNTTSFISSNLPFLSNMTAFTESDVSMDDNNNYTVTRDGIHVYPYDVLVIAAGAERTLGALSELLKYSDLDRNRVVVNPGPTRDTIVHAFASNIVYAKVPPLSFVAQMEALRHNKLKLPTSISQREKSYNSLNGYTSLIKCVRSLLFDVDRNVECNATCTNSNVAPYEGANIMAIQIDSVLDEQANLNIGNKSDRSLRAIANPLECNILPEQHKLEKEEETQIIVENIADSSRDNINKNSNIITCNSLTKENIINTYSKYEHDKNAVKWVDAINHNYQIAAEYKIDKYVSNLMHFASRQFDGNFVSAVNLLWHFIEDHKRFAFTRLLCVSAESEPLSMGVSESVNNAIKSYWNELVNHSHSRRERRGGKDAWGGSSGEQEHGYPHFHFLSHSYITAIDTAHYTATLYNYLYDMYIVIPYNTLILDLPLRAPSFVRKSNLHRIHYVNEHLLQPDNNNFIRYNNKNNNIENNVVNNIAKQRERLRRFLEYVYHDEANLESAIQEQEQQQHETENHTHRLQEFKVIRTDKQRYKEHAHMCNALHMPQRLEEMFTDEMSFVDVDPQTLQHRRYNNIFAIGDVAGLPTLKSYASAQAQVPVVAHNVYQVLQCIRDEHNRTISKNNNINSNNDIGNESEMSRNPLNIFSCSQQSQLVNKKSQCKESKLLFAEGRTNAWDAESHSQAYERNSLSRRLLNVNKETNCQNGYIDVTNNTSQKENNFGNCSTSEMKTKAIAAAATATKIKEFANSKEAKQFRVEKENTQQNRIKRATNSVLTLSQENVNKNEQLEEEQEKQKEECEEELEEKWKCNEVNARVYDGYTSFMINMSMKQSMWPEFCYSDAQRVQFDNDRQVRLRSWLQNMDVKTDKFYNATVPIISTANDINQLLFNEQTRNINKNVELYTRKPDYITTSENTTNVMSYCDPFVIDSTSPLPLCNYHLWDNLKWQGIRGRTNSFVQEWCFYELMHFFCFTRSLWHPQYWLRQPQYNDTTDGEIIPPQSSFLTSPIKYLHELL